MNEDTRRQLLAVGTATIATQLLKRGIRRVYMAGVRPLDPDNARFAGPAFTLRFVPYREDRDPYAALGSPDNPARRAIEDCPEGGVIVADARREAACGVIGDILVQRLAVRGVAAFVSDGGIRDARAVAAIGLPVHGAGPAAPATPTAHQPADCGLPIACGGVAVYPADVLVGDGDGVVVIPAGIADEVAAGAVSQEDMETFIHKLVADGRPAMGTYPPTAEVRREYEAWVAAGRP